MNNNCTPGINNKTTSWYSKNLCCKLIQTLFLSISSGKTKIGSLRNNNFYGILPQVSYRWEFCWLLCRTKPSSNQFRTRRLTTLTATPLLVALITKNIPTAANTCSTVQKIGSSGIPYYSNNKIPTSTNTITTATSNTLMTAMSSTSSTTKKNEDGTDVTDSISSAKTEGVSVDEVTAALGASNLNDDEPIAKPTIGVVATAPTVVPPALQQFVTWILDGSIRNIIVVAGAGMSVSAGIPDFRTPGTGLYDNLQLYNLPYAEAIFDIDFYKKNPYPFIQLASALWPGQSTGPVPTITHSFLNLLSKHNILRRIYTQNIDGLEFLANIPEDVIVECHGHFRSASCIVCGKAATDMSVIRRIIVDEGKVPLCPFCEKGRGESVGKDDNDINKNKKPSRNGYIKPDIVFFGEGLPNRFHKLVRTDTAVADCCLIIGTSLQVGPVNQIPEMVHRHSCKRILFNRELVGKIQAQNKNVNNGIGRDLFHPGDCDDTVLLVADLLGWKDELLMEHNAAVAKIRHQQQQKQQKYQE